MNTDQLRINNERFQNNFFDLAEIGKTSSGGIHRPTFSSAHLNARKWFRNRAITANLDFKIDDAGNHSAILNCGPSNGRTLLIGSHLDSVPNGGKYDGALGVLAGLEVLQTVQDSEIILPFNLEVIDFTDEEGTLMGLLGSSAVAGTLTKKDIQEPRGGHQKLQESLATAELTENGLFSARRDPNSLVGYLELHIEQGSNLIDENAEIGIVTSIVGIGSFQMNFIGKANHAGTTSMLSRHDAALGASSFTVEVRNLVIYEFPACVANVGNMKFVPGAFNIIPERVLVSFEYRSPSIEQMEKLENAIFDLAKKQAENYGLAVEIEDLGKHSPAKMDKEIQSCINSAAQTLGLKTKSMASGAGHDAQSLAKICPSGMIFVPSIGGISHSPEEKTSWEDCANGANTLLLSVLKFSNLL